MPDFIRSLWCLFWKENQSWREILHNESQRFLIENLWKCYWKKMPSTKDISINGWNSLVSSWVLYDRKSPRVTLIQKFCNYESKYPFTLDINHFLVILLYEYARLYNYSIQSLYFISYFLGKKFINYLWVKNSQIVCC